MPMNILAVADRELQSCNSKPKQTQHESKIQMTSFLNKSAHLNQKISLYLSDFPKFYNYKLKTYKTQNAKFH